MLRTPFCDRFFIVQIFFALICLYFKLSLNIWVLLAISGFQTEFSKKLTHNNSKTPFNLFHSDFRTIFYINFLKIDFSQYFAFSPPFPLYSMLALIFRTSRLSRKHSLSQPEQYWSVGCRGGVIFNWKESGKKSFESLGNVLLSHKFFSFSLCNTKVVIRT